jgi:hypothetical protein
LKTNRFIIFALVFTIVLFLTSSLFAEQNYTLNAPGYRIEKTPDGFDRVFVDGYFSYAVPGYPDLPCKIFRFVIPPDVAGQSVSVRYSVKKSEEIGKFDITALPPMATRKGDIVLVGKKAEVYSNNTYYPENTVEYLGFSQMRKWRFVNVKYTPFRYNPVTKDLIYIPEVEVTISYDRVARSFSRGMGLADGVMDERAKKIFENYPSATEWYRTLEAAPRPSVTYDYVIITTNSIQGSSAKLGDFVTYLSGKGYSPLVITEDEYGGLTGQSPNGTAEKIRQWLINNYSSEGGYGIEYVLLIGNPDPSVGDVPMKMCWPRNHESSIKESPTDYFYADLTGNWDLNGNGYFGEYDGDRGTGGVDFANEVYVGRIPVYSGVANLDSVLTKTMNYGNATDIAWRKSALLPMSYQDASTDGAYLSEAMITNYLTPNSYSDYTLYMQGAYCAAANSSFSSDQELLNDVSWQRWRDYDYGMVWWWGHGGPTVAYIGYSGCPLLWLPQIIGSSDAVVLDDNHPSHVYQCSCENGYPENPNNLGTALLYNGAITTTCASRVSWYAITPPGFPPWYTGLKYCCDNASIGYYYGLELVANGKKAAVALFDVKSDMGTNGGDWGGTSWMNLFDFNLYGDPAMSLTVSGGGTGCPPCSGDVVVLENVTFTAGTPCECIATTSITAGTGVTIQSGAIVTFTAPSVNLQPGLHVESGATFKVKQ